MARDGRAGGCGRPRVPAGRGNQRGDGRGALLRDRRAERAAVAGTGGGEDWQRVDLRAHHDACRTGDPITNPKAGGITSSYTEVIALDGTHLLCVYDRLARGRAAIPKGLGETNSVWAVRLTVKPTPGK